MAILVDTNVISDILFHDPDWYDWSAENLSEYAGALNINPIIYTELSYIAETRMEVDKIINGLNLNMLEIPKDTLFLTAQVFKIYRKRGGLKSSPLADFFVGAHAETLNLPILTRDTARYKSYFPKIELISP